MHCCRGRTLTEFQSTPVGTVRGDVQNAPITAQYPGSNAYQTYTGRVTLLWHPVEGLSIKPLTERVDLNYRF